MHTLSPPPSPTPPVPRWRPQTTPAPGTVALHFPSPADAIEPLPPSVILHTTPAGVVILLTPLSSAAVPGTVCSFKDRFCVVSQVCPVPTSYLHAHTCYHFLFSLTPPVPSLDAHPLAPKSIFRILRRQFSSRPIRTLLAAVSLSPPPAPFPSLLRRSNRYALRPISYLLTGLTSPGEWPSTTEPSAARYDIRRATLHRATALVLRRRYRRPSARSCIDIRRTPGLKRRLCAAAQVWSPPLRSPACLGCRHFSSPLTFSTQLTKLVMGRVSSQLPLPPSFSPAILTARYLRLPSPFSPYRCLLQFSSQALRQLRSCPLRVHPSCRSFFYSASSCVSRLNVPLPETNIVSCLCP